MRETAISQISNRTIVWDDYVGIVAGVFYQHAFFNDKILYIAHFNVMFI